MDVGDGTVAPRTDRAGKPRYDDKGCPNGLLSQAPYYPKGEPLPPPGAHAEFRPPVDMGAFERQADSVSDALIDVVYVSAANVDGPWDGNSWATAYNDLQAGLKDAYTRAKEVWVANDAMFDHLG